MKIVIFKTVVQSKNPFCTGKFLVDENNFIYKLNLNENDEWEKVLSHRWFLGFSTNLDNEGFKYSEYYDDIYPEVMTEDFWFLIICPKSGQQTKIYEQFKKYCKNEHQSGAGCCGTKKENIKDYIKGRILDMRERNFKSLDELLL